MPRPLTSDDLDGLGTDAVRVADPRPIRDDLVAAAEAAAVADPDDLSYAWVLAAEISDRLGEHDRAIDLAGHAVTAAEGTRYLTGMRGSRAHLLLRAGRDEEAMRELHALRPGLTREPAASYEVIDPLLENGRAEIAEQWLTAALTTALEAADRAPADSEAALDAWEVVDGLAGRRRQVRADLGLPPDEYDDLADDLDDLPDLVFWPRAAFAALLAADPERAEHLGADWDAHRALVERALQEAPPDAPLLVEVATPAMLTAALADDPDPGADHAVAEPDPGPELEWPPGRNDPCWCASGTKYKKCCLPRARD